MYPLFYRIKIHVCKKIFNFCVIKNQRKWMDPITLLTFYYFINDIFVQSKFNHCRQMKFRPK